MLLYTTTLVLQDTVFCAVCRAQSNYLVEFRVAACRTKSVKVKRNYLQPKMQFFKLRGDYICRSTWRYIAEDLNFREDCCEQFTMSRNSELL